MTYFTCDDTAHNTIRDDEERLALVNVGSVAQKTCQECVGRDRQCTMQESVVQVG